jgi:hypothetical protein
MACDFYPSRWRRPNIFPNILRLVLHYDNASDAPEISSSPRSESPRTGAPCFPLPLPAA